MIFSEMNDSLRNDCPIPPGPLPEFLTQEQAGYIAENCGSTLFKVMNEDSIRKIEIIRDRNLYNREYFIESKSLMEFLDELEVLQKEQAECRRKKQAEHRHIQRAERRAKTEGDGTK